MSKSLKRIAGGVNAAKGFTSASASCGIKRTPPKNGVRRDDLCLVVSETMATAAGVFTTNLVKAAQIGRASCRERV